MADGASEEVKPTRVPRKRAATESAQKKADGSSPVRRKRATRTRATRASKKSEIAEKTEKKASPKETTKKQMERKAPTPLSAEKKERRRLQIHIGITVAILLLGVGGSAMVGYSDVGVIDVNKVIESRNQKVRESGSNDRIIPVQNTSLEPDGGLIGLGVGTPRQEKSADEVASSTASSSATTSPEIVAEESAEEDEGQVPLSGEEAAATSAGEVN